MAQLTVEEARIRVALANPNLTSADVRREADRVIATLESIEFEDNARAVFAAKAAEDEREQAAAAARLDEAYNDAAAIVRRSNPGWGADSVEREAHKLVAENESAIAAMNLKEALAERPLGRR